MSILINNFKGLYKPMGYDKNRFYLEEKDGYFTKLRLKHINKKIKQYQHRYDEDIYHVTD